MKAITLIKHNPTPCCPYTAEKEYSLQENGVEIQKGPYALLKWARDKRAGEGVPMYLLKIKPI